MTVILVFHIMWFWILWGRSLLVCHGIRICPNVLQPVTTVEATEFFVVLPGPFVGLHHCTFAILYILYLLHRHITYPNGFLAFVLQMMSSVSCRMMALSLSPMLPCIMSSFSKAYIGPFISLLVFWYHLQWRLLLEKFHKCWPHVYSCLTCWVFLVSLLYSLHFSCLL